MQYAQFENLSVNAWKLDIFTKGNADVDAYLASSGQNGNSMDKQVSPLPVRHFDFSFEGKNIIVDEPTRCTVNNMSTPCNQVQSLSTLEKTTSSCVVTKRRVGVLSQPNDDGKLNTPSTDIKSYNVNITNSIENTPSSVPLNDLLDISNWLPSEICIIYKRRGISKLYPWQVDCLRVDGVLQKKEPCVLCIYKCWEKFCCRNLDVSFVSICINRKSNTSCSSLCINCAEKAEHLQALLEPLDKHVRSFYGSQGGGTLPKDTSVAVCTIEKANYLLNRLLEEGRLSEVGITVIDELHMVGDQRTGYLLELMLTKLRYGAGEGKAEFSSGESS